MCGINWDEEEEMEEEGTGKERFAILIPHGWVEISSFSQISQKHDSLEDLVVYIVAFEAGEADDDLKRKLKWEYSGITNKTLELVETSDCLELAIKLGNRIFEVKTGGMGFFIRYAGTIQMANGKRRVYHRISDNFCVEGTGHIQLPWY